MTIVISYTPNIHLHLPVKKDALEYSSLIKVIGNRVFVKDGFTMKLISDDPDFGSYEVGFYEGFSCPLVFNSRYGPFLSLLLARGYPDVRELIDTCLLEDLKPYKP